MVKSVLGIAAATMLAAAVLPTVPANAAPIRHAPGIAEEQSGIETVQYRRRYWRGGAYRYGYRGGPYRRYGYAPYRRYGYGYAPYRYGYYGSPYAYAAPYPYYRRYYGPRPFVGIGIGPFGFGAW
jgi:hypothetical protein